MKIENTEMWMKTKAQKSYIKERRNNSIKCCRLVEDGELREVIE